ncbi:hypothetical protein [Gordonia malaquae]|uniref:hypothetical protein n=1 Tax=Gordonia malaquae TaxID=410332 RepID=UPI0030FF12F9
MDTNDYVRQTAAAFSKADALNERAGSLGYGVLTATSGTLDVNDKGETFQVHYSVRPFGFEDGRRDKHFPDIEAVERYLDHLETLPWWRLDLNDDSIVVDGVALTITDKATEETIYLGGGWKWMIGGSRKAGEKIGEGLTHLSVRADEPPAFGRWRKDR